MEKYTGEDGYSQYRLTKKGRDLLPVIVALTKWGDCWSAPDGPPVTFVHECGGAIEQKLICKQCGPVSKNEVLAKPRRLKRAG